MNICTIGIGYVGIAAALGFASLGHFVFCVDKDEEKIKKLNEGQIPIYEPKADELIKKYKKNLFFTSDIKSIADKTNVFFIAVGTPSKQDGSVDCSHIFEAVDEVIEHAQKYALIINKSTVPIGFNSELKKYIKNKTDIQIDIASNPEFLRQGSAIEDFLNPQRVVIGTKSQKAIEILKEIYAPFNVPNERFLITDENSAEMIKYAANSFLALKISYINEIAKLCEKTNADIQAIKKGLSLDNRIGDKFLNPGIGWGGSCFPKDTKAIINIAKENNIELKTIKSAIEVNQGQIEHFVKKITDFYNNDIKNKTIAILGLAFKPDTNDTREAPSLTIIQKLKEKGAKIKAYDPWAKIDTINQFESCKQALEGADCAVVLVEWEEFREIDEKEFLNLNDKVIFDGRSVFIDRNFKKYGIKYFCVGKNEQ